MQTPRFVPLNRRLRSLASWVPLLAVGLALGTGCGSTDDPVAPGTLTTTGGVMTPGATMPWPGDTQTMQPGTNTGPGGTPTGIPDKTNTGLPQPDPNNCIGVNPEPSEETGYAYQTGTSTGTGTDTGTGTGPQIPDGCTTPPNCIGMQSPPWELHDYQPNSCGFNRDYGINTFNKHVTMVVLLTGW